MTALYPIFAIAYLIFVAAFVIGVLRLGGSR